MCLGLGDSLSFLEQCGVGRRNLAGLDILTVVDYFLRAQHFFLGTAAFL